MADVRWSSTLVPNTSKQTGAGSDGCPEVACKRLIAAAGVRLGKAVPHGRVPKNSLRAILVSEQLHANVLPQPRAEGLHKDFITPFKEVSGGRFSARLQCLSPLPLVDFYGLALGVQKVKDGVRRSLTRTHIGQC